MDIDLGAIRSGLILLILLIASLSFHEWAHARVADLLGDDTPRSEGRLTLSPIAHIDLMGTIVIPLVNILLFQGGFAFLGWGRPVRINPANFKHRSRDEILVSLAGPFANLVVALVAIVAGAFLVVAQPRFGELINGLVIMNVGLAVFNLLPIPPLDGGTLLRYLSGMSEETYRGIAQWSWIVLLALLNVPATRHLLAFVVGTACEPYAVLCGWINPTALQLIFPA